MRNEVVENMRSRAEQFRRLADLTHDREMAHSLRHWADEVDADVRRLSQLNITGP